MRRFPAPCIKGHDGAIEGIGMAFDENRDGTGNRLLTGWKQIAFYFGKDESTAKRWAVQRGLPVRRVPGQKRASVYAYTAELATWLRQQGVGVELTADPGPEAKLPPSVPPAWSAPAARAGYRRLGAAALAVFLLLGVAGLVTLGWVGPVRGAGSGCKHENAPPPLRGR
jgi:hypothetical protein